MKAVCVSNFNYYDRRIKYMQAYLESKDYEVHYITGDYDTMNRQMYTLTLPRVIQLPLIQYKKNISFERIYSHYHFAKAMYEQLLKLKPDVIYAMVPPNFVSYFIRKYKKKYPKTIILFDVFDMWPETYPLPTKPLLRLPFKLWQHLRTKSLNYADAVLSECQMFEHHLKSLQSHQRIHTLYPCQLSSHHHIDYTEKDNKWSVCYLGSINNIIDIEHIYRLLGEMAKIKPVHLHIIGNGEKIEEFIQKMQTICVAVRHHGNVYCDEEKQHIFNQCAFGINVLKSSVFIGLTLKTIDYLKGGLPLLNTVQGDTKHMVETHQIGINVCQLDTLANTLSSLTPENIMTMKKQSRYVFEQYFSEDNYMKQLDMLLTQMGVQL
ncbi:MULTISPECIES: glycosyltransferase [unclassified Granulicatella]|uniref:glycosyltransferase n=1 Tax=unclassified Granulicatella TaxID=2630493 RepID=UPI00107331CA|nr:MULTISPECIES: glycosyltransferase [unclassified Granulicatella]MBF0780880.1 hypothetical protein [Granulicatella sp. 19428wC4_WM01]TFU93472.1 hypothetical protein E4T68_07180 [Granulicatella sp. WM01]